MNIEKYKKTGLFKLSSGEMSTTYYNLKEAMGEPKNLREMTWKIQKELLDGIDVIIGLEYGGIPLAVSLSLSTNIPYAILRKETKTHGMKNRIEGYNKIGTCVIIDDVATSGKSLRDADRYLRGLGYDILQIECYLERK